MQGERTMNISRRVRRDPLAALPCLTNASNIAVDPDPPHRRLPGALNRDPSPRRDQAVQPPEKEKRAESYRDFQPVRTIREL